MSWVPYCWLAVFALLGAVYFVVKGKAKTIAASALLCVASVFVLLQLKDLFSDHGHRLNKSVPTIGADQAELMLRLNSSMAAVPNPGIDLRHSEFVKSAEKTLAEMASKDPQSEVLAAKQTIVLHEAGESTIQPLSRLSALKGKEAQALYVALTGVYSMNGTSHGTSHGTAHSTSHATWIEGAETPDQKTIEATYKRDLPYGWYQDVALMELYKGSGQEARFTELRQEFDHKCAATFQKLCFLVTTAIISIVIGVVTIIVQLFFLPRRLSTPESLEQIRAPKPYGAKAVVGVFVAWLAIQNMVALFVHPLAKDVITVKHDPLIAAVATAALYAVSMGPALFFMWFFAFRPNQVTFLDGIKWRTRVGNLTLGKLIGIGALTWCAAVPCVLVAFLAAIHLLKSEGSSNPVIALAMEASRTANVPVVLVIYFTLGVMAPLCEESLFRGFLYSYLRRTLNVPVSMIVSAFIFAFVHLDLGGAVPLLCLGLIFAYVFERTKSVVPSMIAHSMWNSGTFTLILLLFGS